jgi:hypothetical protein
MMTHDGELLPWGYQNDATRQHNGLVKCVFVTTSSAKIFKKCSIWVGSICSEYEQRWLRLSATPKQEPLKGQL